MQAVLQRKDEEDRQMKQLVQALQAALQKEKVMVHSLEEQVCGFQLLSDCNLTEPSGM